MAQGGNFALATSQWFGKTSVADVVKFYRGALSKDWDEEFFGEDEEESQLAYASKSDPNLALVLAVTKTDAGTMVTASMMRN